MSNMFSRKENRNNFEYCMMFLILEQIKANYSKLGQCPSAVQKVRVKINKIIEI